MIEKGIENKMESTVKKIKILEIEFAESSTLERADTC